MKNINSLIKQAKSALDLIENGKKYSSKYLIDRFESAINKSPGDHLVAHMRDVISKVASDGKLYFTQKEIGSLYDEMYGLSGGRTSFRQSLGDLLPDNHVSFKTSSKDYSKNRANQEIGLEPVVRDDLNELSNALSSVFELGMDKGAGSYGGGVNARAERMVEAQLKSMNYMPQSIKAVRSNDHFILCLAKYNTSDFSSVNVKIPVRIKNGTALIPDKMIDGGNLVDLNKENLYVHIKDESNQRKKSIRNRFASERGEKKISLDAAVVPASLSKFADVESSLVAAASKFTNSDIDSARSIVYMELSGFGVVNPQIKVYSSDEKSISFSASIPTSSGRSDIVIPVEFHNGNPSLPSKFIVAGRNNTNVISDFNAKEIRNITGQIDADYSSSVAKRSGDMSLMSYHELIDNIITGVEGNDYRLSEDALSVIGDRFPDHYSKALNTFSDLLKISSNKARESDLVKAAVRRGDLITIPTSVELYCPKLGLPLSKISFDAKGRVVPKSKMARAENLRESGVGTVSSRILLS